MTIQQLTATNLQEKLEANEELFLLDVREPHEFTYVHIAGSTLIPLNQLPSRLGELDPEDHIITICHHGMRSQQAALYLQHYGFANVSNLQGGIDAWAVVCDPTMSRY